jgi:Predicted membrane protein (DUF2306)
MGRHHMSSSHSIDEIQPPASAEYAQRSRVLHGAILALTAVVWISAGLFALYILARYIGAVGDGRLVAWNRDLPRLYEPHMRSATTGIGIHFLGGTILLLLGPLQFVQAIRGRAPAAHRWIGRLYATAALLAGIGGLAFIALKGTVGGTPMNIGFALYGALTVLAAVMTPIYAWRRQFVAHRAWAIRLFALVIGSWLFRMDYGLWLPLTHRLGHTSNFDGPFDVFMDFFFFIPNLIVAEIIIRAPKFQAPMLLRGIAVAGLTICSIILVFSTYYFTRFHWGEDILARLHGL